MKSKVGRPKFPKGEARGKLIGARFKPDEVKRVESAAKHSGQVKSEWVRQTLLAAAPEL